MKNDDALCTVDKENCSRAENCARHVTANREVAHYRLYVKPPEPDNCDIFIPINKRRNKK
jgi:hypothetical protein